MIGIFNVGKIVTEIPSDMVSCAELQGQVQSLNSWFSILRDSSRLVPILSKNVILHITGIVSDYWSISSNLVSLKYFDAGKSVADLAVQLLGAIPNGEPVDTDEITLTNW